jgi:hypothetical protein
VLNFSATSTAGGIIEFDFSELLNDTDGGTSAAFNAMSITGITTIPEPSSTALLGLGGLALIVRRRRA